MGSVAGAIPAASPHGWRRPGGGVLARLRCGCIWALLLAAPALLSAGDIQIFCEPGVRVLLDGRPAGVATAREDGLYLVNVPAGTRTLHLEKDGFLAQVFRLEVPDHPIEITAAPWIPAPAQGEAVSGPGNGEPSAGGTVVITSAPQNCTVDLGGTVHSKRSPQLVVPGLPPGEHPISFSKDGWEPIRGVVTVRGGVRTAVRGNLIDGRVEVLHQGKGSLRVLSRPDRCGVRFLGRVAETSRGRWNLSHVPAGEHRLVVSRQGREITTDVLIAEGRRTVVVVSFLPGDEPVRVSFEPE